MAKATVASLEVRIDELEETIEELKGTFNDQLAALETRVDELEENGGDRRKRRGRNMSDEQRAEAGRRLQQARAEKLGLDSIEQLHALHLRPGTKPTKKDIARVKKEFPVEDAE